LRLHVVRIQATLGLVEAGVSTDGRRLHGTVQATAFLGIEGAEFVEPPIVAMGDVGRVLIFDFGFSVLLVISLGKVDSVGVSTRDNFGKQPCFPLT
jgi:hypothetical protein